MTAKTKSRLASIQKIFYAERHHMGLDTHDYGLTHSPMEANMVFFTVEPGFIFGGRLEFDWKTM
jgi:hypothetical protein